MFACGFAISPNDDHMQVECVKYLLYVQDMSRAVQFYRDVLGLTVRMESPGWSEVARGDALIGLHAGGRWPTESDGTQLSGHGSGRSLERDYESWRTGC